MINKLNLFLNELTASQRKAEREEEKEPPYVQIIIKDLYRKKGIKAEQQKVKYAYLERTTSAARYAAFELRNMKEDALNKITEVLKLHNYQLFIERDNLMTYKKSKAEYIDVVINKGIPNFMTIHWEVRGGKHW